MLEQVQALAYYDAVRLKSEKAGIYIVTYQLPQAPARGLFALNCFSFFPVSDPSAVFFTAAENPPKNN